ncbi:hypothetical protein F9U64_06530 [Gracilibacillus oryzae]|uniref:DUF4352 domain-containing protein n=1 Tax=Gracilibacillus oryzae TaxID=1672701 RepID=A0A7C8GUL8_9BACI|nr:hypothetical protein [Gracilibacillus oryzae]KAB8138096.1 hypothetical protein F9U64_06530 [Gracilibacillus oryzae]
MKRNKKPLVIFFLCISVILLGCTNTPAPEIQQTQNTEKENNVNKLEQKITDYTTEIESLQTQTESLKEQNQYLISVINTLSGSLSDEEMLAFAQAQFIYELQVNGESIPQSGKITVPSGEIEILLSEKSMGYEFLQPEWSEKGKISGDYIDQILNFDSAGWSPAGTDGTVNSSRGFKTTNAKAGEQISFQISDELKKRLQLDTSEIVIEVE